MKKLLPLLLSLLLLTGCAKTYDGPTTARSVLTREETTCNDPSDGSSTYTRREYTYDIYGNQAQVLESSYMDDSEEPWAELKTVLSYDEAGNVIRQRNYDISGWFPKKLVDVRYSYDDQGRRIAERHSQGLEWDNADIVYDDEAKTRTTTSNGNTIVEYLDENGWVIRSESDFGDGARITEEFDRRPDGLVTTARTYRDGVLCSVSERTYDDQGRPLTWTTTEDGETTVLFRWEYGENYEKQFFADGSWTVTDFNADGTPRIRMKVNADGIVQEDTLYRYTELQVPAKEELP